MKVVKFETLHSFTVYRLDQLASSTTDDCSNLLVTTMEKQSQVGLGARLCWLFATDFTLATTSSDSLADVLVVQRITVDP